MHPTTKKTGAINFGSRTGLWEGLKGKKKTK